MKMPEEYIAFFRFDRDAGDCTDEIMAKVAVSSKIEKGSLATGLKSGIAEFVFTLKPDEDAFTVVCDLAVETGGVEIIGVYPVAEIDYEDIKVVRIP